MTLTEALGGNEELARAYWCLRVEQRSFHLSACSKAQVQNRKMRREFNYPDLAHQNQEWLDMRNALWSCD